MKKLGRIVFYGVACVIVMAVAAITLTIGWRPFVGPRARSVTNKQFERTPERLARGQYLVRGLLGCEVCHTVSDWTQHGAPKDFGRELAGQNFPLPGFPGTPVAPNLTPDAETGAANWSDDQI